MQNVVEERTGWANAQAFKKICCLWAMAIWYMTESERVTGDALHSKSIHTIPALIMCLLPIQNKIFVLFPLFTKRSTPLMT